MSQFKAHFALLTLCCAPFVRADVGSVRLSTFPDVAVADARSTITVTAEVRENSGRTAINGTQVFFQTTLGHFQQSVVTTTEGYARAVLVTSGTPGTAKITASALAL